MELKEFLERIIGIFKSIIDLSLDGVVRIPAFSCESWEWRMCYVSNFLYNPGY